jgi:hypothetical protein
MNSDTLDKLKKIVEDLPPEFYGTLEIGFQKSRPGQVKITRSYRLDYNPKTSNQNDYRSSDRGAFNDNHPSR